MSQEIGIGTIVECSKTDTGFKGIIEPDSPEKIVKEIKFKDCGVNVKNGDRVTFDIVSKRGGVYAINIKPIPV